MKTSEAFHLTRLYGATDPLKIGIYHSNNGIWVPVVIDQLIPGIFYDYWDEKWYSKKGYRKLLKPCQLTRLVIREDMAFKSTFYYFYNDAYCQQPLRGIIPHHKDAELFGAYGETKIFLNYEDCLNYCITLNIVSKDRRQPAVVQYLQLKQSYITFFSTIIHVACQEYGIEAYERDPK